MVSIPSEYPTQARLEPAALQSILERAAEDHRAGRLRDAETAYQQVLKQDPINADAHHLLGLVAHARFCQWQHRFITIQRF